MPARGSLTNRDALARRWERDGRTFSAAIDERLQALWVLLVDHVDERGIYPAPSLDGVQAADDKCELQVVVLVLVLNLAKVAGERC